MCIFRILSLLFFLARRMLMFKYPRRLDLPTNILGLCAIKLSTKVDFGWMEF